MGYNEQGADVFAVLNGIRDRLKAADLSFRTASYRDDAISLLVNVPGEYWEIDVLKDGSIDVEVYASTGLSEDPWAAIDRLIDNNTDDTDETDERT